MTRLTMLFAAMLLHALVSQDTRASLEGTVIRDSTGKPVAGASVELTVVEGARVVSRSATSGEDGRFSFQNLPPGEGYQIVVTAPGLWPTAYGQQRSDGPWTPITLAPGQHLTDLRISARAITQLGGKVLDSLGKPQVGASVVAMRPTYVQGRREIQRAAATVTNLRGEYWFTNLPSGRYYIRVSPRNEGVTESVFTNPAFYDRGAAISRAGTVKETEGYPTVYYPGVPLDSAKVIPLGDGQVLDDVDITVTKSGTSRVRGTITNSATGKRVAAAQVALLPTGSSPDSNWGRFFDSKDGSFDLRAVLPGKYFLNAIVSGPDGPLAGRVAVEIRGGASQTFDVRLSPGTDLAGRIILDDRNATIPDFSTVSVRMDAPAHEPIDGTLSRTRNKLPSASASVKPDGSFILSGVMPWDYRVNVSEIPGVYLKAIRQGNIDVLTGGLRVEENAGQPLEIVLATDGGRLDGRLLDGSTARVVLVPEARNRRDRYQAVSSSNTARFQITNIPPGRYKVFAWQNPVEGAWTDPDYLERYESRGVPVEIRAEASEYVELQSIP